MLVLGIETSCDETSAALVRHGREVLSNVVYSQIALHQPYGGVVPEIASRSHIEHLTEVTQEAVRLGFGALHGHAVDDLTPCWSAIDAIAVTYGPGLASSLLIGLNAAKALALRLGKPLIAINHLEAHLHAVYLNPAASAPDTPGSVLGMVVSGGHTCWVEMPRAGTYRLIGQTLDDAAGEALDKAAKLLALGYPGGPVIDRLARQARGGREIVFPKGQPRAGNPILGGLTPEMCVSFSGLKTALMYRVRDARPSDEAEVIELVAAYQEAVVEALVERCEYALAHGEYRALAVGGGVSLNSRLRQRLAEVAAAHGVLLLLAEPQYCGDNAAMIAGLAGWGGGVSGTAALQLDVVPALEIGA